MNGPSETKKTPLSSSYGGQPAGLSKTSYFDEKNVFTLSIGEESTKTLKDFGLSDAQSQDLIVNGFWKYKVASFSEAHSEGHKIINAVTDSFSVFSTGAMPVGISASGYLIMTVDQDHRLDFLHLYHNKLRGKRLSDHRFVINLVSMTTVMKLRIKSISMQHNTKLQDLARLSFEGVGFGYRVYPIVENDTPASSEVVSVSRANSADTDIEYIAREKSAVV